MMSTLEIVQRAREATGFGELPMHDGRRRDADEPRRRAPRVPFALLVVGLIVGSLVLLLALNTASAANELRRHELTQKDNDIAARLQDLKVRVAASAAPANLARAAAELGMVPAGNPAFVVIGPDGKAKIMGKPKAATEAPVAVPKKPKPKPTKTTASPSTTTPPRGATTTRPGATPTRPATSSKTPTASPTPPRPTSTPTPVVTLPGGTR